MIVTRMRRWDRLAGRVTVSAALVISNAAAATLLIGLDLKDLAARANDIVVADVAAVSADWTADHRRIVTTIDLTVVEGWKGAATAGAHLRVVQPGGVVGNIAMHVDGMPRFSTGERALLFLRGGWQRAGVVGMAQGKRSIHRDVSARWMVGGADRAGADLVHARGAPATSFADTGPRELEALREEVAADVRAEAPAGSPPSAPR
jgi:hypothetical protein